MDITLEIKYHVIKVKEGKLKRARLEWIAPGLNVYVQGSLAGHLYEQAANVAMNYALGMHIPPRSMRRARHK